MSDADDIRFERDAREHLRRRAQALTPALRSELARRRRLAVEAAGSPRRLSLWLPAGVAAATAAVAMLVMLERPSAPGPAVVAFDDGAEDMEIVLAEESLELYEELEFFNWLSSRDAG